MRKSIDILVYKFETFDTDCFKKKLDSFSKSCVFLMGHRKGVRLISNSSQADIAIDIKTLWGLKNNKLNYYLHPLFFVLDNLRIFNILVLFCLRYRVQALFIDNTYIAALAGLIRKVGLVKKFIYLSGDWLAGSNASTRIWGHIGCDIVFPFFDYCACRTSDITMNCSDKISEARTAFWHRKVTNKEEKYTVLLKCNASVSDEHIKKNKLVFLGNARKDSGLDIVLHSLKTLHDENGISLKIIGGYNDENLRLQKLAKELFVDPYVAFKGFVERGDFQKELADCFCGINLLLNNDSYSSKTLPAKIYDYLQYLLPVIITEGVGIVKEDIMENNLGLVIEPHEKIFINAVQKIYSEQTAYRDRVLSFLTASQGADLAQLFK